MGLNVGMGDRCNVSCDDPGAVGCNKKTSDYWGQENMNGLALVLGWRKNYNSGSWTCPGCASKPSTVYVREKQIAAIN